MGASAPHVRLCCNHVPATDRCASRCARGLQDDVALGRVCDAARDARSRAPSAGAAAGELAVLLVPALVGSVLLTLVAGNAG